MADKYLPERDFIKQHIIDHFNYQYGKKIRPEHCVIFGIQPNTDIYPLGYEVATRLEGSELRLRFYAKIREEDTCHPYRQETEGERVNLLGDEVHVASGSFARRWITQGIYRFDPMEPKDDNLYGFITEDGKTLFSENGYPFVPENFEKE